MKIKVRNKIYDGSKEPIMIIINHKERENIKNMDKNCTKYCEYPKEKYTAKEIKEWMKE